MIGLIDPKTTDALKICTIFQGQAGAELMKEKK